MTIKKVITVRPYSGNNKLIHELRSLLEKSPDFIKEIIVHGSIATNEEILYSDFDGLIIVEANDTVKSKRIYRKFIRDTLKLIYNTDPFQHHGWFILKESDFIDYPQTYFPHELFEYSRTLGNTDLSFEIQVSDENNYYCPFKTLKDNLLESINFNKPKNLYQLKSFLSGLMLMPCLYLQAKHKKGFYKKYSFEIAKTDFKKNDWKPMETASYIRLDWAYELNFLQQYIMTSPYVLTRKITKRVISPKIPERYRNLITDIFYRESGNLINLMDYNIRNEVN